MDKTTTCFFSGHRLLPSNKIDLIRKQLRQNIISLIDYGITDFVCGGALGFDYLAEQILIDLRDNDGYDISIHLYLPCKNHYSKWSEKEQSDFTYIVQKVDDVRYVSMTEYTKDCMLKRNYAMANASSFCICFLINYKTGTGSAVRYASYTGVKIINLADELYDS